MKVLFDHGSPFLLAYGGWQIQIEQTKVALQGIGVDVEFLRWWDPAQRGDLIHFFGRPAGAYIDFAHGKGVPIVMAELLTGLGSRSSVALAAQRSAIKAIRRFLPKPLWAKMGWDAYMKADRAIALTSWEASLMQDIFEAPPEQVTTIPNGVSREFLTAQNDLSERDSYLICSATITPRKRVLELAEAAIIAETPIWVAGGAYSEGEEYAQRFLSVAQSSAGLVRYLGPVNNRSELAEIYRKARGFVLLSSMESLSLSALEAAACGCPLLLSDLPWARSVFGQSVSYCQIGGRDLTAKALQKFYVAAPSHPRPLKPKEWAEIATELKEVYEEVLSEFSHLGGTKQEIRARGFQRSSEAK